MNIPQPPPEIVLASLGALSNDTEEQRFRARWSVKLPALISTLVLHATTGSHFCQLFWENHKGTGNLLGIDGERLKGIMAVQARPGHGRPRTPARVLTDEDLGKFPAWEREALSMLMQNGNRLIFYPDYSCVGHDVTDSLIGSYLVIAYGVEDDEQLLPTLTQAFRRVSSW